MARTPNQLYVPDYAAIELAAASWGARWDAAQRRYDALQGALPEGINGELNVTVTIIDGMTEPVGEVLPQEVFNERRLPPSALGVLGIINYEGKKPPKHTMQLLESLQSRPQHDVPAAFTTIGYPEGTRRIDRLRSDAWDLLAVHTVRRKLGRVVGVSVDADATAASPDYFPAMTDNPWVDQPNMLWTSSLEFDRPGGDDLPVHRVMKYLARGRERFLRPGLSAILYAGNMALRMGTYAGAGPGWVRPGNDAANPYGKGEPRALLLNVWQNAQGMEAGTEATDEDVLRASTAHVRKVVGVLRVSPRREIESLLRTGDPRAMADQLTTLRDNPYRRLSRSEVAELAMQITSEGDPMLRRYMAQLDRDWLGAVQGQEAEGREFIRKMRLRLGLPEPQFDGAS